MDIQTSSNSLSGLASRSLMPPYPWQEGLWEEFCRRIASGKSHHALLLSSQMGLGAQQMALSMAQYILCHAKVGHQACFKCRACELFAAKSHPDLKVCTLEEKATQIKVDQIRKIAHFVNTTSQLGLTKCILVMPADSMNINAANALLKNLEEPAGDTLFILVTSKLQQLLPTIRSRCGKLTLPPAHTSIAIKWLEQQGVENASIRLSNAGNSPLTVLRWLNEGQWEARSEMVKAIDSFVQGATPIQVSKRWHDNALIDTISWSLSWVEGLIRYVMTNDKAILNELPLSAGVFMARSAPTLVPILYRFWDKLNVYKLQAIRSPNLNSALVVEELAIDWFSLMKAVGRLNAREAL